MPYFDPEGEQRIDKDFCVELGVDKVFFERVFHAHHIYIWFPSTLELLQAGVVHEIVLVRWKHRELCLAYF